MYTVAVIVGSLRKDSINKKLAKALISNGNGILNFNLVNIDDIPVFNQDREMDPPPAVTRLKEAIGSANGVLIVTPEYNRSIPGVLKNILDWGSRPYGQNVWGGKPAAIAGTSTSTVGTALAQSHVRIVLNYLDMLLMNQPEMYIVDKPGLIGGDGSVSSKTTSELFRLFLTRFSEWIGKLQ